jgi:GT2 family glycosyltransferase
MSAEARVTVVTVTHASAGQIAGFLAAVPPGLPVVVVDNASPDATPALARAARPGAVVLEMAANLGFGAGCNRGLAQVGTEFALLANPDARLDADAIAGLLAAAEAFPEAALLAPLIVNEAGRPERSWNVTQLRRRALPRDRAAEPWPEHPFCADYASGACLLLRMAAGLRFDEAIFLFYEDDLLCAAAGGVVVVPAARVAHAGGGSSAGGGRIARLKAWHMAWSRLHLWQVQAGQGRREAWARLSHHAGKALGHAATLRWGRAGADLAGLAGTLAWLRGRPADRRP